MYLDQYYSGSLSDKQMIEKKILTDEINKGLTNAILEFKKTFLAGEIKEESEKAEVKA